jgi:hypothetical protein
LSLNNGTLDADITHRKYVAIGVEGGLDLCTPAKFALMKPPP